MKRMMFQFLMVTLVFAVTGSISNCAGSKSSSTRETKNTNDDSYDEIEKLLGISRDEGPANDTGAAAQQGDDDLVELLTGNEQTPPQEENTMPVSAGNNQPVTTEFPVENTLPQNDPPVSEPITAPEVIEPIVENTPPPTTTYYAPASSDDYQIAYDEALQAFHSRRYRESIDKFESLLARSTSHSLSDNAQYWIGECYYALKDYRAAIVAFEKVFTFKRSNKNDYAQYKLGMCYNRMGNNQRAREEFQSLIDNYKNASLIRSAQKYLN